MAVDLARKNLLHDKLRFFITVMGVAFAVTLVFVQVGLFLGLLSNSTVVIEHMSADLWVTSKNTPNIDFSHTFPESYVERVRSVPGVAKADNLILSFVQISLPTGAQESMEVYAMKNFRDWNLPWNYGGNLEDLRRGPYFMLDDSAVKRFGTFEVGDYREIVDNRMQIIGKTHGALSFTTTPLAFVDYDRMQAISPSLLRNKANYIVVKLAPGADLEQVRAGIKNRLPYNDVWTSQEWAARSRNYWVQSTGLGLNMMLTVFLGVLVGVVVVAQTLYTSTMEHLKEFGTVKAIGGSNGDIYKILAKQAVISAVAGFACGVGFAYGLKPLMAKIALHLIIPESFLGIVLAGTIAMCLAASMLSFRKIASIDPALVFRT
jgi:putative ABC transport system permease protein